MIEFLDCKLLVCLIYADSNKCYNVCGLSRNVVSYATITEVINHSERFNNSGLEEG